MIRFTFVHSILSQVAFSLLTFGEIFEFAFANSFSDLSNHFIQNLSLHNTHKIDFNI